MIDWGAIVAQFPSIALALLFAWFALRLIDGQRNFSKQMMADWAVRLEGRDEKWQNALREHDEQMLQLYEMVLDRLGEDKRK